MAQPDMAEYSKKKELFVYKARLSEQMERYEDMAKVCYIYIQVSVQLGVLTYYIDFMYDPFFLDKVSSGCVVL